MTKISTVESRLIWLAFVALLCVGATVNLPLFVSETRDWTAVNAALSFFKEVTAAILGGIFALQQRQSSAPLVQPAPGTQSTATVTTRTVAEPPDGPVELGVTPRKNHSA